MLVQDLGMFEGLSLGEQIAKVREILENEGFKPHIVISKTAKHLVNYHYTKPGVNYVFSIVINKKEGITLYNLMDLDVYNALVNQCSGNGLILRANKRSDGKYCVMFGGCNIRLHGFVLLDEAMVDHISGNPLINIEELLRGCDPMSNMKNKCQYCKIDKKNHSFSLRDTFDDSVLDISRRVALVNQGFTFKSVRGRKRIISPSYPTMSDCYQAVNQFEQKYFGGFNFNPLVNFEDTWYAIVLHKMIGLGTDTDIKDYNRDYWKKYRPEDAEYYCL